MLGNILNVVINGNNSGLKKAIEDSKRLLQHFSKVSSGTVSKTLTDLDSMYAEELKKSLEQSQELKKSLGQTQEELLKSKEKVQQLKQKWEDAKAELNKYKDTLKEIQSTMNTLSEWGIKDAETHIREAYPDYDKIMAAKDAVEQTRVELKNAELDVGRINNEIKSIKLKQEEVNSKVKEVNSKIKETKKETSSLKKETSSLKKEVNGIVSIFKRMLVRKALMAIISKMKECINLLTQFDFGKGNTLGYNKALSDLSSAFKRLSANIASFVSELLVNLAPALTYIMNLVGRVVSWFTKLGAVINGKTSYTVANPDYWNDYAKSLNESSAAQKKLISGFDELNVYSSNSTTTSTDANELYEVVELEGVWKKIAEWFAKVRETLSDIKEWIDNSKLGQFWENLFGDDASLGSALSTLAKLATALGVVKLASDLLKKAFSSKNKTLQTQTGLEGESATQLQTVLSPAFALATSAALGFAGALSKLPEHLPALQPQLQLQPVFSSIEELQAALESISSPVIQPQLDLQPVDIAIADIESKFGTITAPKLQPTVELQPVEEGTTEIEKKFNGIHIPVLSPSVGLSLVTTGLAAIIAKFKETVLPELKPSINFEPVTDFIEKVKEKIRNIEIPTIQPNIDVSKALESVQAMWTKITTFVTDTKSKWSSWATDVKSKAIDTFTAAKASVIDWTTTAITNTKLWAQTTITNITTALNTTKTNVKTWVSTTASNIKQWATNTSTNVRVAATNMATNLYNALSTSGKNVSNWVNTTSSNVSKWASNTASNIAKWASNICTNIGNALSTAWTNFKNFMKNTGQAVSGWWSQNKMTVINSAIAAGVVTAAVALIPYTGGLSAVFAGGLKEGGVIDSPMYALIGEGSDAKRNPEIVTPENKMRDVISENNGELISAFAQMTKQVITAIGNVDMSVSIGDDVIAKSAARGNTAYKRMTGTTLI